jgi:glutamate synthase domain-containing protein 2
MSKLRKALIPGVALGLGAMAVSDLAQRQHAIRRNFPIVGRFRYWLESVGPELRQYIVTNNDEERPFSRDQRRWSTHRPSRRTPTSDSAPTTRST